MWFTGDFRFIPVCTNQQLGFNAKQHAALKGQPADLALNILDSLPHAAHPHPVIEVTQRPSGVLKKFGDHIRRATLARQRVKR